MYDVIGQTRRIQRELLALKSGFRGSQKQFFDSVVTTKTFYVTSDTTMRINLTFPYTDFPQLYVTVWDDPKGTDPYAPYITQRSGLYEWRIYTSAPTANYIVECVCISENTPTTFLLTVDP